MFKTIIWATDGSRSADRALPYAKALASATKGRLVAVHAEQDLLEQVSTYQLPADEDEIDAKIHDQIEATQKEGIDASVRIMLGTAAGAARLIAEAAREVGADAIVAGSRHSLLAELLGESVTERLVHIAPCPVLVVPPEKRDSESWLTAQCA